MTKHVLIYGFLIVVGILIAPFRRRQHLLDAGLLDRIPPNRFLGLEDYLDESGKAMPCEAFWMASRGIQGLCSRMREMLVIVRLLQHYVRANRVSRADATYVWQQATLQLFYSLLALPESILCSLWSRVPHVCALFALRFHYQLSLATITLCSSDDTPADTHRIQQLL